MSRPRPRRSIPSWALSAALYRTWRRGRGRRRRLRRPRGGGAPGPGAVTSFIALNGSFNTMVSMMQVGLDMRHKARSIPGKRTARTTTPPYRVEDDAVARRVAFNRC